jgi:hypothetical protein
MFKLDKKFLEGLGVGDMSEAEMEAFLEHLQEEMEVRVGERMSADMNETQIDEFERIIDGDTGTVQSVLMKLGGDYRSNVEYKKLMDASRLEDGSAELLAEYASLVWLKRNCPQYAKIVEEVASELKEEVKAGKDSI